MPETTGAAPRTVVVIGVSAGGPRALQQLLPRLPQGFSAPVLVVQHFAPELFGSLLSTLSSCARLPVSGAAHEQLLEDGQVYLCPPGHQCSVLRRAGQLVCELREDRESTYRPCIDATMQSVARSCGAGAIGVLLTGMGADGVEGLRGIMEAGGLTIVESEQTASIYGMPREALDAGVAQRVLPLHQISTELLMELRHREQVGRHHPGRKAPPGAPEGGLAGQPSEVSSAAGGEDVEALLAQLQGDLPLAMESARQRLMTLPGEVVLPHLIRLLSSEVPVVRATAVEIARRVDLGGAGIVLLQRLCADADPDLRLFAMDIAREHAAEELLEAVLTCCEDPNTNVALAALEALGGYHDPRALERLAEALAGSPAERAVALTVLGRSPAAVATGHLVGYSPEGYSERFLWLRALAGRSAPDAAAPLLAFLEGDPGALLPHALGALARLCSPRPGRLAEELQTRIRGLPFEAYLTGHTAHVREAAVELIAAVGTEHHLELLDVHFDRLDPPQGRVFLELLAAHSGARSTRMLRSYLDHHNPDISSWADELLRGL